jgi:hypothetical protein
VRAVARWRIPWTWAGSVAETSRAGRAVGGCPIDPAAARTALDERLTAVVRGRISVREFRAWWNRDAAGGVLGALSEAEDRRGRAAVDSCRDALEEHRKRRIGEEELLDRLVLAREALRD